MAMKITRFIAILAAAGVFAACQNEETIAPVAKTFEVSATASVPATKTAISQDGEGYVPTWKAGDKIAIVEKAAATTVYASNALEADALQATFTATMNEVAADAYAYCAVYPYEAFKTTTDLANLVCTVPSEQTPATMTSFDGNADILVSEVINLAAQPTAEALAFNMRRLTATGMVSFTNIPFEEGETVLAWTLKVNGALAGTVNVDPAAESLSFTATEASQSIKVKLPVAQTSDFTSCFTCLPYTLQTGENYSVTLYTNKREITKKANVSTALEFAAEKVKHLTVNMEQTANSVIPESFSTDYDYVITSTLNGVTYVLPNATVDRNPALVTLEEAGLSMSNNGTIIGEVTDAYRWTAVLVSNNNGVLRARFYHKKGQTRYDLVNAKKAQGMAVLVQNSDDSYTGAYDLAYTNKFEVRSVEGGYTLYGSENYWGVTNDSTNGSRWRTVTESTITPIRFHRISQIIESTPGIINNADDVTAGKYIVAGYNATQNQYYLLSGEASAAAPTCVPAAENGVNINNDVLVEVPTNVDDIYVWNISAAETTGYWTISSVSTGNFLYGRESGGGIIIGTEPTNNKHSNEWIFKNIDGVMAAQSKGCVERYISPYFNTTDSSVKWYMQKIFTDYILLIPINE